MKTLIRIAALAVMIAAGTSLKGQNYPKEYLGLPGDNLNLYAVMNTFQESRSLKVFERSINDPDNRINNLDLNGDNLVDYIMVSDYVEGNTHYIVMRVAINRKEKHDVAVFTIQRNNSGEIYIQLAGDESLYGKNYIIEPSGQLLLADWPLVRNIFRSDYTVWESDWGWGYYPDYWISWSPFYWHYYYGYNYYFFDYYYTCYHRSYAHHDPYWHDHYYNGRRVSSQYVTYNVHAGNYRSTYSHPEKIQEGEEQYRNRYPEGGRRGTYSTSTTTNSSVTSNNQVNTSRRSSVSETSSRNNDETNIGRTDREQRTIGDQNTTRRIATDVTRSTFSNTVQEQNGRTETRQSTIVSSRPESRTEQSQAVSSGRSEYRPAQSQSVTPVRQESRSEQSQSVATARQESKSEQSQTVIPARSSQQSRNETVMPERRTGGEEKQMNNNGGSENEKKSETANVPRRK